MKKILSVIKVSVLAFIFAILQHSNLFAQCSPEDALPAIDFSKVGYRQGDSPIPYQQRPATIYYPEGTFTINSLIRLTSGQVLRGAGRDKTILYFPNGLRDLGEPCGNPGVDCYDWKNGVIRANGNEIGIEDLTIEFRDHGWCHYCGSNNGGFNGIELQNCTNSWVKNVTVRKSDTGIFISGGSNNTVDGVHVYPMTGLTTHIHFAISAFAKNNLVTNFRAYGNTAHGVTGNWGVDTNVFSNGWGENLYIEPDHNCNGAGGAESCSPNMMYSNITGTISGIQTVDRAGNPLQTILWNVGNTTKCPVDAHAAQLDRRIQLAAMTLYENCEYGGYRVYLPATGGFSSGALGARGLGNNALSSFTIKKGYLARLYQDDNYTGSSYPATSGDNCLVDNGFNDNVTSLWLRPNGVTTLSGNYYIRNKNGLYMDVSGGSTADGAKMVQWSYTGSTSQQFQFTHIADGVYQIKNVKSGKSLTIQSKSISNGAAVEQWAYSGVAHQKFIAYKLSTGNYQLIATHCSKILKIKDGSATAGAFVEQYQNDNQPSSEWQLISVSTGAIARSATNGQYNEQVEIGPTEIAVFPNPVKLKLQIRSEINLSDAVVTIVDGLGSEKVKANFNHEGYDVSDLKSGLYMIQIVTMEKKRIIKKFIKE
jgi:hypothetical protein